MGEWCLSPPTDSCANLVEPGPGKETECFTLPLFVPCFVTPVEVEGWGEPWDDLNRAPGPSLATCSCPLLCDIALKGKEIGTKPKTKTGGMSETNKYFENAKTSKA